MVSKRAPAYVAALKVQVTILCLFGAVLAAYYFFYVTLHQTYLIERDFRLLATLGDEIVETIDSQSSVIGTIIGAPQQQNDGFDFVKRHATHFVPAFRSAQFPPKPRLPITVQLAEPDSRLLWVSREDQADKNAGVVRLELQELLQPLLDEGRGAFDSLLIASPDGRVVFQSGDAKLRMASLDRLTRRSAPEQTETTFQDLARAPALTDVVVSGATYKLLTQPCCGRMIRAPVASTAGEGAPAAPASGSAAPVKPADDGWVLCGLVSSANLSSRSYAVSFSTLVLLCALLVLGLLSWPFLKLTFLGEAQRVKAYDVVLVMFSTTIGVALLTVGAMDYVAYGRELQRELDRQLRALADDINTQATEEVNAAYGQLRTLQTTVKGLKVRNDPDLTHIGELFTRRDLLAQYPYFESFALLDDEGMQRRKLTLGSLGTLFVAAADREYFTHWPSAAGKPAAPGQPPAPSAAGNPEPAPAAATAQAAEPSRFIEAIRSRTTGAREAVISMPSEVEGYRVAALSTPLRSLLDPVLVPGFGFVVIDDDGKVLFHSDSQHNLSENFFLESDSSRRLRALVSARHSEWLDIQYWGDEHRALVTPMAIGQRWTLVTFYDTDLIRTVNIEWVILALVLLGLYISAYAALVVGVLVLRPKYRAPWLWPDVTRSREYVDLLPPLVLLAAAFSLSTLTQDNLELVRVAWLVPCLTWLLLYYALGDPAQGRAARWPLAIALVPLGLLLVQAWRLDNRVAAFTLMAALLMASVLVILAQARRTTSRGPALPLPVNVSFGLLAALALTIATVLPAAAFFKVSHAIQIENFIKYGQLNAASARIADDTRDRATDAKDLEVLTYQDWDGKAVESLDATRRVYRAKELNDHIGGVGVYQAFFFATRPAGDSNPCPARAPRTDPAAGVLAGFLPFYSDLSVPMRELGHDQADDGRWSWRRLGPTLTFCAKNDEVKPFQSTIPALFAAGLSADVVGDRFAQILLIALLAGVVVWLVRFALHKVFVTDLTEPLWTGQAGSLDAAWASNLFLVSSDPLSDRLDTSRYCEVDLAAMPADSSALTRWFDQQLARIGESPSGQHVLLLHFEHRLQDPAVHGRKLALLERVIDTLARTTVIVSAVPPNRFSVTRTAVAPAVTVTSRHRTRPQRWARLLSNFTVVPVVASPAAAAVAPAGAGSSSLDWVTAGWREVLWRVNALGFSHSASFLDDERRDPEVRQAWKDVLPYAWHPDRTLSVEQLLTEVGERSHSHYQQIWESCTPAEKLVLGQIAAEGLVNGKTKRTVRMLMARRLVRRQPNFVLLNETFRQFVLSESSRAEVTVLEQETNSAWDAIRAPFLVLLIGSLAFFIATQRELFNTTLGIVTGVAATLPAVMKMISMFGSRKAAAD